MKPLDDNSVVDDSDDDDDHIKLPPDVAQAEVSPTLPSLELCLSWTLSLSPMSERLALNQPDELYTGE